MKILLSAIHHDFMLERDRFLAVELLSSIFKKA